LPIECGFAIYGIRFLLAFHLYQIKRTMTQEKLNFAQQWFASMGYDAQIDHDSIYLYLDGFSVHLSNSEIFSRAEQFQDEQNRD
jgi:hypothetical protein